jgi:hypothetical protein
LQILGFHSEEHKELIGVVNYFHAPEKATPVSPISACPLKIKFLVQIHTKKSYCEIGQNLEW